MPTPTQQEKKIFSGLLRLAKPIFKEETLSATMNAWTARFETDPAGTADLLLSMFPKHTIASLEDSGCGDGSKRAIGYRATEPKGIVRAVRIRQ